MATMILSITALVLALSERSSRLRFCPSPLFRRYFASDIFYLLSGFVAGGSLAIVYVAATSNWVGVRWGIPRLASLDWPLWVSVPLALLAVDMGNYAAHTLLHRFEPLWEFHKIHHSSRTLDWLATFRSHLIEQTLRRLLAPLLLIIVGFPLKAMILASGLFVAWAMLNHSNLRLNLRFLELVLITPRLHRLHHVPATEHRNFGTVFTFWDRLRGTFIRAETQADCTFGVAGEVDSYPQGWLAQLIEPLRRVSKMRLNLQPDSKRRRLA
jgi:sterol desaturase/sphingolipid hydroxylase (fatty acid hydroxylase superfamily)